MQRLLRHPHLRPLAVYLLAIAGPTLVLLYLGLQSVQRQRQAVDSLIGANARLAGDQFVAAFERDVNQLAESCLLGERFSDFQSSGGGLTTVENARRIRIFLDGARKRHPIARHFFLMQQNDLSFPLLEDPVALSEAAIEKSTAKGAEAQFAEALAQAEALELRQNRPGAAAVLYRKSFELPVPGSMKALVLARIARCLRKSGDARAAVRTYQQLARDYDQVYDPFGRPYGLIAGFELAELELDSPESEQILENLYRGLINGRWEISGRQLDYFLEKIRKRTIAEWSAETAFVNHFKMARDLQASFRHPGPLDPNQVYNYAFSRSSTGYQVFYVRTAGSDNAGPILGFFADLDWIESRLVSQAERFFESETPDLRFSLSKGQETHAGAAREGLGEISFRSLSPSWKLLYERQSPNNNARREMLIFAGATSLVLGVLGLGVFLLLRDVSREAETSRLRSELVSSVSHELKTPLTLIRLYGETLLYKPGILADEGKEYAEVVTRESERLTRLIENVLDFSRIERKEKKEYRLEEGDLASTLAPPVEIYARYLRRRDFVVETDFPANLPRVRFDAGAVSQAALNLVDNAAKFSDESKYVAVRMRSGEDHVIFEVEDRGIGIEPDELDQLFQQFYRSRRGRAKGGYGLGLFLVKHIMDAHHGKVEVDSPAGKGSRFRLVFPVAASGSKLD